MSLPDVWVDRIFDRLIVVYGQAFLRRWDGLDLADVKANWAYELRGFATWPDGIRHALENLPPDGAPPTVLQFRALCLRKPPAPPPALPLPPADPQRVAELIGAMPRPAERDPKAWAWGLKRRDEANPRSVSPLQRAMYQEALRSELAAAERRRLLESEEA